MTKFATIFTVALIASANIASAYATEPEYIVTNAAVTEPQIADNAQVCIPGIAPALAAALALPKPIVDATHTALACADS